MPLDQPIFDIRFRIKYWLQALSEEQRSQLRGMSPEDSLRFLMDGLHETPPLLGGPS